MGFFLDKSTHGDEEHYQLTISKAYDTFAVPPSPSFISILIALLLSDKGTASYKLTRTVAVKEEPPRSAQPDSPDTSGSRTMGQSSSSNATALNPHKRRQSDTAEVGSCPSTANETTGVPELFDHADVCVPW